MRISLALLAACFLTGCIATREHPVFEEPPFTVGQTTYREVVAAWGNPTRLSGETRDWTIRETLGGQVKVSYYFIGFTVLNESAATRTHHLSFDDSNTLTNLTTTISGKPNYSLYPW